MIEIRLSPHGRLRMSEGALDQMDPLEPEAAKRLHKVFESGDGAGLLHLGGAELDTRFPPAFGYWRAFGRLFFSRLCFLPNLPDLDREGQVPTISPEDVDFRSLIDNAPPFIGAEYLTPDVLKSLWDRMQHAFGEEAKETGVTSWLKSKSPLWNIVGRVCFHLGENKRNEKFPFAFLATYASRLSDQAKVQYLPLGKALKEYSANKKALLSLLLPVQKAAEKSLFLKGLVDAGRIFHPLPWTPAEAHQFLKDIPLFESGGIIVRVPDWWKAAHPPRPQVEIRIDQKEASTLGLDALLVFSMNVTLGGKSLSEVELKEILASTEGLHFIRGQWVEIDRVKLSQVLNHWESVQKTASGNGLSFIEGMRLLSGVTFDVSEGVEDPATLTTWSHVSAGPWLAQTLERLRSPEGLKGFQPGPELHARLRPYQQTGLQWLSTLQTLRLGGCLADDMGLGKTIQVLALFLLLKKQKIERTHLLVVPASLLANWKAETDHFTPGLKIFTAHPSAASKEEMEKAIKNGFKGFDAVMTTYGSLLRFSWIQEREWSLIVLDEAQAIKNPNALQTRAVKTLKSRNRLALTGTPVENRLSDLWSLFDFICPGLLGSAATFKKFSRHLTSSETTQYGPLRQLVRPYILRRLKTDKKIIADLPDKTELQTFCQLTKTQAVLYQQSVKELERQIKAVKEGIQRKGLIFSFLMRFKQICNHPSQWLGDNVYAGDVSGKYLRLREITDEIAAKQEKALIFTQFKEMTRPLNEFLTGVFGRSGLILSGDTPVTKRQGLVTEFQEDHGPPYFILSLKAGGTGLNLTAATHVIHFDRWWNPAVENQATDRAYRIGQKKNVLVHKFVCRGTVEEKIDEMIQLKKRMSGEILEEGAETLLTEMSNEELLKTVALDINSALEE